LAVKVGMTVPVIQALVSFDQVEHGGAGDLGGEVADPGLHHCVVDQGGQGHLVQAGSRACRKATVAGSLAKRPRATWKAVDRVEEDGRGR